MLEKIRIVGDGVAACCCARLLQDGGYSITLEEQGRPRVPALLLNESTQSLLCDIFGDAAMLTGLHPIRRRIVSWGASGKANDLPHSGLVASESLLLGRLRVDLPIGRTDEAKPDWTVLSAGDVSGFGRVQGFGSRSAVATQVTLKSTAPQDACWIEAVESGWLFLLSSGNNCATLLAVGQPRSELLEQSCLIAAQVDRFETDSPPFPAYPRILSPLCGSGWLACGTAAIGFDPVCGEGVGNALREAILVAAVLRACLKGADPNSVLKHYSARLLNGFLRHLRLCAEYYEAARCSSWWDKEIELLQDGIRWTERELKNCSPPRYRLVDFDLQEVS